MSCSIASWLSKACLSIDKIDAELLLCHHLKKSRTYLYTYPDELITPKSLIRIEDDFKRLSKGYPIAYLIGYRDFWDMRLIVNENTLIPRPETELIIETLKTIYLTHQSFSVIDLGTGTGAIAIAITREFPNAKVYASDISDKTLNTAKENASNWAKSDITFFQSDWFLNIPPNITFNCIVSNPPYIAENDPHLSNLTFEPYHALVSKQKGLFDIRSIIEQASSRLKPEGLLILEHGYNQSDDIKQLLKNWCYKRSIKDINHIERITLAHK